MKAKWGIPQEDLDIVVDRDKNCVYCHKKMIYPWDSKNRQDSATIEHLNYKQYWNSVESYKEQGRPVHEIITICCGACNSSRGSKSLIEWFETDYCIKNNINSDTVDDVVKRYIDEYESEKTA